MKKILIVCSALLCFFLSMATTKASPFTAIAGAFGFNISEDYEPINMLGIQTYKYVREKKADKHFTQVNQVLMRSKSNTKCYAFIYKIVTSPYQERNWGFMGINSYGNNYFNYDIKTNISFPFSPNTITIADYAPKNQPAKSTVSIGCGLDSSGPNVSADVSFDHSELKVISNTKTGESIYNTHYKIRSSNATKYLKGEISSYGMLTFISSDKVWIDITHEIQYEQQVGFDKTTSAGYVKFYNRY